MVESLSGSPASGEPAVSVRSVSKTYQPSPRWMRLLLKTAITEPVVALHDVSFDLLPGQACVVVGPNGAGKSTLFRVLTGLTTPSSGEAEILGHSIDEGRLVRSLIGYMPAEDRNLMLRHTCAQNLDFRGKLQGIPRSELGGRVDDVLDRVGLLHARDRAATSLSTGMKARLQLAAAILHEPKVLILDEPTSAVDPVGAHELLTLIEDLTLSRGLAVVISSHRLEEIDALGERVIFLDEGSVLHDGSLGQLRRIWDQPRFRFEFVDGVDVCGLGARLAFEPGLEIDVVGSTLDIATDRPIGAVMALLGSAVDGIESVDRVIMPIRDLFHRLVTMEKSPS